MSTPKRILFTGASSFTGMWFVRTLADAGHQVTVTMTQSSADSYTDPTRRRRVEMAVEAAHDVQWGVRFGDHSFVTLVGSAFDVLCHHAADVTNYKSPDFDVITALTGNTRNLRDVLAAFHSGGGRQVVLTGSVFEGDEGAGDADLPHFSPYGLSKALTAQVFRDACRTQHLHLGKFVIPNPFGPFEEARFTAYLMKTWREGKVAGVNTPEYIRDNIHVDLLARCYAAFVGELDRTPGMSRMAPSGHVESQGAFACRLAREMQSRLSMECVLDLAKQSDFSEPRVRINTEPAPAIISDWSEEAAWDGFASYYEKTLSGAIA